MTKLIDYDVVLRVRVQGQSLDDVPALVMEALGDHDVWPVEVYNLDTGDDAVVVEFDKNTCKIQEGDEA